MILFAFLASRAFVRVVTLTLSVVLAGAFACERFVDSSAVFLTGATFGACFWWYASISPPEWAEGHHGGK